jgi:hypothetical protein
MGVYVQSHACWLKTRVSNGTVEAENASRPGEEAAIGRLSVEWRFEGERRCAGGWIFTWGPCFTLACLRAQAPDDNTPLRERAHAATVAMSLILLLRVQFLVRG